MNFVIATALEPLWCCFRLILISFPHETTNDHNL